MKTIKLTSHPPSVADLLSMAREDVLVVTTEEGDSFVISTADDFDTEVQLLRQNHRFLTMLDEFKRDDESIPLEEAEKTLR
jgi:KaiC/GvpD/RAD55 family RecA-like ATPase